MLKQLTFIVSIKKSLINHENSKNIKRILAERNIFPEDNVDNMNVDSNGNGITKVITNYINGKVIELGEKYDVDVSTNRIIYNLIKAIESDF